jgi:hypothetical protein
VLVEAPFGSRVGALEGKTILRRLHGLHGLHANSVPRA